MIASSTLRTIKLATIDSYITEAYDRGEKFYRYRRNPVLPDYVLVSSQSIAIDIHHKNNVGEWVINQVIRSS